MQGRPLPDPHQKRELTVQLSGFFLHFFDAVFYSVLHLLKQAFVQFCTVVSHSFSETAEMAGVSAPATEDACEPEGQGSDLTPSQPLTLRNICDLQYEP